MNCQTHLNANAIIPLHGSVAGLAAAGELGVQVEIRTRDGKLQPRVSGVATGDTAARSMFQVEIR